tara:strand:- start:2929 stop:3432 length:504 start_codon:yes stop_codon:yes gene_type:complete
MVKKKKSHKKSVNSDYGPVEKLQHGEFVEIETAVAGVKAIRNATHDPIAYYFRKSFIDGSQYQAAELFAQDYRKAALVAHYAQSRWNRIGGGDVPVEAAEAIRDAKKRIKSALGFVGKPLSGVIEHVCGDGNTAGTWKLVAGSSRPDRDGMVALRLGLDGLVQYYRI